MKNNTTFTLLLVKCVLLLVACLGFINCNNIESSPSDSGIRNSEVEDSIIKQDAGLTPPDAGQTRALHADAGSTKDAGPFDAGFIRNSPIIEALIDNTAWTTVSEAEDPLSSHQPVEIICPRWAYGTENLGTQILFELETGDCNYGSFRQSTLVDVYPGDVLRPYLWHLGLWAAEPATAHAALLIENDIVWETFLEVPSIALVMRPKLVSDAFYPVGSEVVLHIHNHGTNNWRMLSFDRETVIQ